MDNLAVGPTLFQFRTMFLEHVRANMLGVASSLEHQAFFRLQAPRSGMPFCLCKFHMTAECQSEILAHVRQIRAEYLDTTWLLRQLAHWALPDESWRLITHTSNPGQHFAATGERIITAASLAKFIRHTGDAHVSQQFSPGLNIVERTEVTSLCLEGVSQAHL